jgi:hypothetical protein
MGLGVGAHRQFHCQSTHHPFSIQE